MESISLLVQSPLFLQLSGPIVVITLVGLFWWRAGSIHSVFDRLWRLVAGRTEVQDPVLQAFIQQNRDLEKFRFIYGLKVEKQTDLHRLLPWIHGSPFDIARLQKVRRWIDVRSTDFVVMPPKGYFIGKLVVIVACALGVVIGSSALSSQAAWLQMRKSRIWILTDAKTVHHVFNRWSFDATLCEKDPSQVTRLTGFLDTETASICGGFKDGSLTRFVNESIELQRTVGAIADGIAIILLIGNIFGIGAAVEARRMRNLLDAEVDEPTCAAMDDGPDKEMERSHQVEPAAMRADVDTATS